MRNRYFMATEENDTLEIIIFGDITSIPFLGNDVSSDSIVKTLNQSNAKNITVKINSYGGEVGEAIAIYNELRAKSKAGVAVTTIDMGFACSSASVIFCAGDKRVMSQSSLLMIHNPWMSISGNSKELQKAAEDLEKIAKSIVDIYQSVINITAEELDTLMDAETWIEAADAVEMGFATQLDEDTDSVSQAAARVRRSLFAKFRAEEKKPDEDPEKKPNEDPEKKEKPDAPTKPDEPTEPEEPTEPDEPDEESPEPDNPDVDPGEPIEEPDEEDPEKKKPANDLFKNFKNKRR